MRPSWVVVADGHSLEGKCVWLVEGVGVESGDKHLPLCSIFTHVQHTQRIDFPY